MAKKIIGNVARSIALLCAFGLLACAYVGIWAEWPHLARTVVTLLVTFGACVIVLIGTEEPTEPSARDGYYVGGDYD